MFSKLEQVFNFFIYFFFSPPESLFVTKMNVFARSFCIVQGFQLSL